MASKIYKSCDLVPIVLLTRISEEDIKRYTRIKKNKHLSFKSYNSKKISIKQEPTDTTNYENIEGTTWEHFRTNIKTEPTDLEVKSESMDTYENPTNDFSFSNYSSNYCDSFNCVVCYKDFNNYEEFVIHKNLTHKNYRPYLCQICGERFVLNIHLINHVLVHVNLLYPNNTPLTLSAETQSSENNLTTTSTQNSSFKEFAILKCKNCNFTTRSNRTFKQHESNCNNTSDSSSSTNKQCKICIRSFPNQVALNGHMRYHSLRGHITSKRSLRKTSCNIANSKVKTKINCHVCNKHFFFKKNLDKHVLQHENKKVMKKENGCNIAFKINPSLSNQKTLEKKSEV